MLLLFAGLAGCVACYDVWLVCLFAWVLDLCLSRFAGFCFAVLGAWCAGAACFQGLV